MKYIKTFEKVIYPLLYKEGDYVLLDTEKINKNNKSNNYTDQNINYDNRFGIINTQEFDDSFPFPYLVKTYAAGEDEEGLNTSDSEIVRLMTPEEIKNFKIKIDANKFNI